MSADESLAAGQAAMTAGRYDEAAACFDDVVVRLCGIGDIETRRWVAYALGEKAIALCRSGLPEKSLGVDDALIAQFRDDGDDYLRTRVLMAFDRKARALEDLGRHEEQLQAREAELALCACGVPAGRPLACEKARTGRAIALSWLGRDDEAIADWGEVLAGVGDAAEPSARVHEAQALLRRAQAYRERGDYQAALADLERLLARFAPSEAPYIARKVAEGLLEQVWVWKELGLSDLADAPLERLTTEFAADADQRIVEVVTQGMFLRAEDCYARSQLTLAERLYDGVLERVRAGTASGAWEAAGAAVGKSWVLARRDAVDEALAILDLWLREFKRRFPDDSINLARMYYAKMARLDRASRFDDAVRVANEVIQAFGDSDEPTLREYVAAALLEKATVYGPRRITEATEAFETLGARYADEALEILDTQIAKINPDDGPQAQRQLAPRLLYRAYILADMDREEEAADALDSLIERYGDSDDPGVMVAVSAARATRTELDIDE